MNPRERLKRYRLTRKPNKMTVQELAARIGCSYQFVYALEDGKLKKVPGLLLAARIQAVTGIPASAWDRLVAINHQRPRLKTA